ncbi:hypothetical protein Barb4_01508 [Bacteroidales bacterium Barb4]|nr:hypothetical protein Barb4_01508 [Bacteroidales bacterium Barb4]
MTHHIPHKLFGRPFRTSQVMAFLTPHSALLHVGLKSSVPPRLLGKRLYLYERGGKHMFHFGTYG